MSRIIAALALFLALMLIPFAIASNDASADPGHGHGHDHDSTGATIDASGPGGGSSSTQSASGGLVSCKAEIDGQNVHVTCKAAGVTVLDTDLPISIPTVTVTVTLPPVRVTQPPVTIHATQTVHVPGDSTTVIRSGPTATVTAHSTASSTETLFGPGAPGATATVTVTAHPTQNSLPGRQPTKSHATLVPDHGILPRFPITVQTTAGPVEKAVLGFGAVLALVALVLLGMWLGYYLGFKDSDRNEAKFLDALLKKKD